MAANTTTYSNALKVVYLPKFREQLQMETPLYDLFPKTSEGVVGKQITMQLHTGYNEGVAAISEGGALPSAGNSTYDEAIVPTREIYGRLQISNKLMKASRNQRGAMEKALTREMEGLTKNFTHDLNRQLHGDGSGVLSLVDDSSPDTTLEVDASYGVANAASGTQLYRKGMRLEIFSAKTGGTQRTGTATITGVTTDSSTPSYYITIDALPSGTSDGDYIFRESSRGIEWCGIMGAVDSNNASTTYKTTYLNINRSTAGNEFWNANVLDNGGSDRALTEELMQETIDEAEINGEGKITHIVMDRFQRRKYISLVSGDRRFVPEGTLKIMGGAKVKKTIAFNDIPIIVDKYAVPGWMYFLDRNTFKIYQMQSGPDWMDEDGAVLSRVAGYAAYEATLGLLGDLGCERPNCNAVLRDLNKS